VSDATSSVGLALARDKYETSRTLRAAGLPAADHRLVATEAEVIQTARAMGFPLVIKPADRDRGTGVVTNIRSEDALSSAYRACLAHSRRILLERHVSGWSHRVTVIDGAAVKVTRKVPAGVVGDGQSSIEQLIGLFNGKALQRRDRVIASRHVVAINDELRALLAEDGLELASVLDAGRFIPLRRASNSTLGASTGVLSTEDLHPDNLSVCVAACTTMGLDIAGVDVICEDIRVSLRSSPLVICEVNGGPQLGSDAVRTLLSKRIVGDGRIPFAILLHSCDSEGELEEQLPALAAEHGYRDTSCASRVSFDGSSWPGRFRSDFEASVFALRDRRATALLCALHARDLLCDGLPVHHVDRVFSLGSISEDALSLLRPYTRNIEILPADPRQNGTLQDGPG
jgi:cyanophycin synthetase